MHGGWGLGLVLAGRGSTTFTGSAWFRRACRQSHRLWAPLRGAGLCRGNGRLFSGCGRFGRGLGAFARRSSGAWLCIGVRFRLRGFKPGQEPLERRNEGLPQAGHALFKAFPRGRFCRAVSKLNPVGVCVSAIGRGWRNVGVGGRPGSLWR